MSRREDKLLADINTTLLHYVARLGGEVFGPIPEGTSREFFCLDENTWIWHEETKGTNGITRSKTTRYDVRSDGVFKSQGSNSFLPLSLREATNLYRAIGLYENKIETELKRLAGLASKTR